MPTRDWTREQIIAETIRQSQAGGADAAVVLAVFDQETGGTFDERAVGDGGDSFGLRQLNRYGQLYGHTPEWAMDPANAIPDAVRALRNATTAMQATRVQNPADHTGYARSLQPRIARWREYLRGNGSATSSSSSSARRGGKIVQVIGPLDGPGAGHMDHVHVSIEGGPSDSTLVWIAQRAAAHRLTETSGVRTPAENAAAGGAAGSHHLSTDARHEARDYSGAMPDMEAFQREMRAARGTSGGDAGNDGMQPVGFDVTPWDGVLPGDPSALLPSQETVYKVLLFVLGLGLFALGVVYTFKDVAISQTVGSVTKGGK